MERPFIRETTPFGGRKLTMVLNHLLRIFEASRRRGQASIYSTSCPEPTQPTQQRPNTLPYIRSLAKS